MKKSTVVLFLAFSVGALLWPGVSYAKNDNMVVNFLLNSGKEFDKQGKVRDAAREFKKILLIDPDNQAAKDYLEKTGLRPGSSGGGQRTTAKAAESSQGLSDMKARLENTEAEKRQILAITQDLIRQQFGLTQEIFKKDKQLSELKDMMLVKEKQLAEKEDQLAEKEDQLAEKEDRVSTLHEGLNQMNGQLDGLAPALPDTTGGGLKTTEKESAPSFRNPEIEEIIKKDSCIADLKERLAATRKELAFLILEHQKARAADTGFKNGSEDSLEKVFENEVLLEHKRKEIEALKGRISEFEQKFALNERIIREKENDIKKLSEELSAAQEKSH